MKKLTIAAATISCCLFSTPAFANSAIRAANKFCDNLVEMNQLLGESVAPGSAGAQLFINYAGNDFNGFSYADLYGMSKAIGTNPSCNRVT